MGKGGREKRREREREGEWREGEKERGRDRRGRKRGWWEGRNSLLCEVMNNDGVIIFVCTE